MKLFFRSSWLLAAAAVSATAPLPEVQNGNLNEGKDPVDLAEWQVRMLQCQHTVVPVEGSNDEFTVSMSNVTYSMCSGVLGMRKNDDGTSGLMCRGRRIGDKASFKTSTMPVEDFLRISSDYYREWNENKCDACDEACHYRNDFSGSVDYRNDFSGSGSGSEDYNPHSRTYYSDVQPKSQSVLNLRKFYPEAQYRYGNAICAQCRKDCMFYESLEENGLKGSHKDASVFISCEKYIPVQHSAHDTETHFIGPVCTHGGSKIEMGLFKDDECTVLQTNSRIVRKPLSSLSYVNFGKATGLTPGDVSCQAVPGYHFELEVASPVSGMCRSFYRYDGTEDSLPKSVGEKKVAIKEEAEVYKDGSDDEGPDEDGGESIDDGDYGNQDEEEEDINEDGEDESAEQNEEEDEVFDGEASEEDEGFDGEASEEGEDIDEVFEEGNADEDGEIEEKEELEYPAREEEEEKSEELESVFGVKNMNIINQIGHSGDDEEDEGGN